MLIKDHTNRTKVVLVNTCRIIHAGNLLISANYLSRESGRGLVFVSERSKTEIMRPERDRTSSDEAR